MKVEKTISLGNVEIKIGKIVEIYVQTSCEGFGWLRGRIAKFNEESVWLDFSKEMQSNIEPFKFNSIHKIKEWSILKEE